MPINIKKKQSLTFVLPTFNEKEKQIVDENQPLAIIEAMKMENIIRSEKKTKIKKINCSEGDSLEVEQIILEFE